MKALFDTNVIVDILGCRAPFFHNSNAVFLMAAAHKIEGIIAASSITDIYYLVRKNYQDSGKALTSILSTLDVLTPVDTTADNIHTAAKMGFADFEDAVIAAIADREDADYIITRNGKDFLESLVPALSPTEFLEEFGDTLH
ncbi:MAG: PIN domain-containing protein [Spirochaetales bacterium]|jgi:predicted nucleic acid-binding protein|nr:PIN domain-containing protein [Spirochaetales bacterium]